MSGKNTFPVHLRRLHHTAHVMVYQLRKNICCGSQTWATDWTLSIVAFWTIYRTLAFLLDAFAILLKAISCSSSSNNNNNHNNNNTIIIIIITY